MNTASFFTTATHLVDSAGSTAHAAIGAYRDGGERVAKLASSRWDRSFRQARTHLTPETRRNAAHARRVFGGYYTRGLHLSASGAATAVDTLMGAATTVLDRAAAAAMARGGKPG